MIQKFAKDFDHYIEIQGLPPRRANTNQKQLDHFAKCLEKKMNLSNLNFSDWGEAFAHLAMASARGKFLVFLDEISWMGKYDPDFAGKLKIAWDTEFKLNNQLILVLCGSVFVWIQNNILNNTGFVGRISLNIKLKELSLAHSIELIRGKNLGEYEQLKLLSLTGGVPKYLEEINIRQTAEHNIERLLLNKSGILYNEFEQIFNDIFDKKAPLYRKILLQLKGEAQAANKLAKALKLAPNGDFFEALDQLCESGFLSKYPTWSIKTTKESNLAQYRITDNFLHFYLKFIFALKSRIEKLPLKISALKNWESIIGYQFQNIINSNYEMVLHHLKISNEEVIQIGPYFQRKNSKQQGCQIDLLIQTKFGNLYVCEIKCKKNIDGSVVQELQYKIKNLKYGRGFTVRPVLIVCGDVTDEVLSSEDLFQVIRFADFLK